MCAIRPATHGHVPADDQNDGDGGAKGDGGQIERFPQEQGGGSQRKKKLGKLDLTDAGNAAQRQTFVPEEKAIELADQGDINETRPG